MSAPLVFAFCQEAERQTVRDACEAAGIAPPWFEKVPRPLGVKPRLILLAIGPEGGAALARWVEGHGLDGVMGIGLVGVTAPIIMPTCCKFHATGGHPADRHGLIDEAARVYGSATERYTNLGPLEPLRAVAERARRCAPLCPSCRSERVRPDTDDCKHFICACGHAFTPTPLRIVIACTPDDGVCRTCGGMGRVPCDASNCIGADHECDVCGGTGKALSSADVALELSGGRALYEGIDDFQATTGGLTVIHYPTHVELNKHGIAAVLKAIGP